MSDIAQNTMRDACESVFNMPCLWFKKKEILCLKKFVQLKQFSTNLAL